VSFEGRGKARGPINQTNIKEELVGTRGMSSKPTFSIGGLKTVAGRTKQKVLQKMGKADETVDIAFNQEHDKLLAQKKMMKRMIKNLKEYGKALRGTSAFTLDLAIYTRRPFDSSSSTVISTSHTVLGEGVATFYEPTNALYQVNLKNQQIIFDVDSARQNLVRSLLICFLQ
jgi:hypothetical protein